jgi:hypothetical protein
MRINASSTGGNAAERESFLPGPHGLRVSSALSRRSSFLHLRVGAGLAHEKTHKDTADNFLSR